MRKLIAIMHISLDGFVAGPKGEMDWIIVDEEIFDFGAPLTGNADAGLYGRATYQMMEGYWPTAADRPDATRHDRHHARWYNSITKLVLSRTMNGGAPPRTKIIADAGSGELQRLKEGPGKDIVMYGSPTAAHALMRENLIDEYWLFLNPVVLGDGIPLFKDYRSRVLLTLRETKPFSSGVVALHYLANGRD